MTAATRNEGATPSSSPKWMLWTGWVLTALPLLALIASGSMKLSHAAPIVEQIVNKFGFQESALTGIGLLELACAAVYAIPQTSVLGAVLVTAYLGGAVVTHVRVGDPGFVTPVILGIFAWGGLYLRDERVRALLPLRR